jgi:hypothetical protein
MYYLRNSKNGLQLITSVALPPPQIPLSKYCEELDPAAKVDGSYMCNYEDLHTVVPLNVAWVNL